MRVSALKAFRSICCQEVFRLSSEGCLLKGDHVFAGCLNCSKCNRSYEIVRGMPEILDRGMDTTTGENYGAYFRRILSNSRDHEVLYGKTVKEEVEDFCFKLGLSSLEEIRGKVILDAGCGLARIETHLAKYGAQIYAFDVQTEWESAYQRTEALPHVHLFRANLSQIPLPSRMFDIVWCDGALPYVNNLQQCLSELERVAKTDGWIFSWVYSERRGLVEKLARRVRRLIPSARMRFFLFDFLFAVVGKKNFALAASDMSLSSKINHLSPSELERYLLELSGKRSWKVQRFGSMVVFGSGPKNLPRKSIKIAVVGLGLTGNKGGPAIFSCLKQALQKVWPEQPLRFRLLSSDFKRDFECNLDNEVEIVARPNLKRLKGALSCFKGCDAVVDMHGVKFGGGKSLKAALYDVVPLVLAKIWRKPLICFTQTYGPLHHWQSRWAAYSLHLADLVLARESDSVVSLREIGLNVGDQAFPDIAILLDSTASQDHRPLLSKSKKWVGINLSSMVSRRSADYLSCMKNFACWLLERGDGVLVIAHSSQEDMGVLDDWQLGRDFAATFKGSDGVIFLEKDSSPAELKAIISKCDVFVGSRYHALVAALSSGVPSLAIGWNYKYRGLLNEFGQEAFSIEYQDLNLETLIRDYLVLFEQSERVRRELKERLPHLQMRALRAVELTKKELQRHVH